LWILQQGKEKGRYVYLIQAGKEKNTKDPDLFVISSKGGEKERRTSSSFEIGWGRGERDRP